MRHLLLAAVILVVPIAVIAVVFGGSAGAAGVALAALLIVAFLALLASEPAEPPGAANRPVMRSRRFLGTVVIVGLIIRVITAVVLDQTGYGSVIGGDSTTFHHNGRLFEYWLEGRSMYAFHPRFVQHGDVGYFAVVGTIYYLVGPIQLVPTLLNCLVGALSAIPAHRLVGRIAGSSAARISALLVAFFPSLLLWSCMMVRDAPVFFLILWSVVLVQDLSRRFDIVQLVFLFVCLGILASLRSYIFLLVSAGFILAFAVSMVKRPIYGVVLAAAGALIALLLVRGFGLGEAILDQASFARLDLQRRLNALAGDAGIGLGSHDLSTPAGALAYLPIGLAYFLLSPFPWEWFGGQAIAIPDMIGWYACIPFTVMGIGYALRRSGEAALPPLLVALMISLFYALVEGNAGIIVRHRAQVLVLLLPFAAIAIARWRQRAARRARAADSEEEISRRRLALVTGGI